MEGYAAMFRLHQYQLIGACPGGGCRHRAAFIEASVWTRED
jgi:hypothetical protein